MIQLRYRAWDFDSWTTVSLEGPEEEEGAGVLCGWALRQEITIERLDEGGEWITVGEEE